MPAEWWSDRSILSGQLPAWEHCCPEGKAEVGSARRASGYPGSGLQSDLDASFHRQRSGRSNAGQTVFSLSPTNPFQQPRLGEIRAGRKFWGYLDTEALRTRYVLAAHFVCECPHIIEIGGYRGNVITAFLRGPHRSVTVFSLDEEFEPLESAELNGAPCRVRHLREYFQSRPDLCKIPEGHLGLVILGLEIHGEIQPVLDLIRSSRVCVLEVAQEHPPGVAALEEILSAVAPTRCICKIDLDLSANELMLRDELALNMNRPFWRRRMVVVEPLSA